MEQKKGINLFLVFIAAILGWTLFKHIDFANGRMKEPYMDLLYLMAFGVSVYLIVKDYKHKKNN